jgi:hypothetical protein
MLLPPMRTSTISSLNSYGKYSYSKDAQYGIHSFRSDALPAFHGSVSPDLFRLLYLKLFVNNRQIDRPRRGG